MTTEEKRLLISQAVKLTALGLKVEKERKKVEALVARGFAFSSLEVLAANDRFNKVAVQWQRMEAEHLELRKKLEK